LIAYASAWLKFHYLPVFTAAILNNQPMGFYSAAVLVKDAHGMACASSPWLWPEQRAYCVLR